MGQSLQAGGNHKETVSWEHKEILSGADHKISKIKLHYNSIIIGIQVSYIISPYNLIKTSPIHMGTASRSQNLKEHEVTFNDDEFLLEVFGRSGAAIDQIGFTTTKSSYSVIGGYGGSPFSLKASAGSYIQHRRWGGTKPGLYSTDG